MGFLESIKAAWMDEEDRVALIEKLGLSKVRGMEEDGTYDRFIRAGLKIRIDGSLPSRLGMVLGGSVVIISHPTCYEPLSSLPEEITIKPEDIEKLQKKT